MRTEQQQLHDAYDKHELGPKLYRINKDPYQNWPALTQCPCGDWLVYNSRTAAWEPLYGHVAAVFINEYPELYPILKAWWPDKPTAGPEPVPWEAIDYNVDMPTKAFYNPGAKVSKTPTGHQNPALDKSSMDTNLWGMHAPVPSPYQPLTSQDSWVSITTTTDNTAAQKPISSPGTPKAPKSIHNIWGILGTEDGDDLL